MSMVISGDNGLTFPAGSTQVQAGNYQTMVNRIINPRMEIDQRNAGASVTPSNNQYTLDRWASLLSQASKYSVQQNAGSVTPPVGFTNYLGVTSLSSYSVNSTDFFSQYQPIEGYNFADLGWGTANAKTITISFQVYSSLTGTFGGTLLNSAANRCYVFSYSIPVANTWTTISVTIAGDTTGTWLTTNGIGCYVNFSLGAGASVSGTAGSWGSTLLRSATGAVSVVGTNGATFYITGVDLRVGSYTVVPQDFRAYGTELQLCQRYYEKSYNVGTTPATNTTAGLVVFASGATSANVLVRATAMFSVPKRANPTITLYDNVGNVGKISYIDANGTQTNNQTGGSGFIGEKSFQCESDYATSKNGILFHYTASIEL